MKKLYIVKKLVEASSLKEAMRLEKGVSPMEIFIADEWYNKVGFIKPLDPATNVNGFQDNKQYGNRKDGK